MGCRTSLAERVKAIGKILAYSGFLFFAGIGAGNSIDYKGIFKPWDIAVYETTELAVRNTKNMRPITFISREEGERACSRLAKTERLEENWLFFDLKDGEDFWLDVGFDQTQTKSKSSTNEISAAIENVSKIAGYDVPVTHYHIHTYRGCMIMGECEENDFFTQQYCEYVNTLSERAGFSDCYFPSSEDIEMAIRFKNHFKKIEFKVVSPGGVMGYSPRKKLSKLEHDKLDYVLADAIGNGLVKKDIELSMQMLRKAGLDVYFEKL